MSQLLGPDWADLTGEEREAVRAWLRGHAIAPEDVPTDGIDTIDGQYRILVYQRTKSGARMLDQLGQMVGVYEFRPADPPLPWPTRPAVTR